MSVSGTGIFCRKNMYKKIFSTEQVNTGRQREIDALKAFSIMMMIITHCIDYLFDYGDHLPSVIIDDILAQSIGASGFMACMGLGVAYSRKVSPAEYVKRGFSLLMTGLAFNIFRYAIPSVIAYLIYSDISHRIYTFLILSSDILQFAGLFFICMGAFARFKLKPCHIFLISVVTSIIGTVLALKIHTGSYALDQLIGFFIATETESYFPLFNWLIYPAFGMMFGEILHYVKDKRLFYGMLFLPASIVAAIYYYIGLAVDQDIFTVFNVWQSFCYVNTIEAIAHLFCISVMICLFFFITFCLPDKAMEPALFISKNITRIYIVHYVIIESIVILTQKQFKESMTAGRCYALAALFIVISMMIVWIYDKKFARTAAEFFGRYKYFWYVTIIVVSLILCIWAYTGGDEFPNMFNGYLGL